MPFDCLQGAVAVVQASPGAAAAAPAEGLPPGVSVSVVVASVDNSTAATPLTAEASPAPARRLLADTVTSSGTGVDVNITITAPASDLNNITALVSEAVSSGQVQQQLQAAGEPAPHDFAVGNAHCMLHHRVSSHVVMTKGGQCLLNPAAAAAAAAAAVFACS